MHNMFQEVSATVLILNYFNNLETLEHHICYLRSDTHYCTRWFCAFAKQEQNLLPLYKTTV